MYPPPHLEFHHRLLEEPLPLQSANHCLRGQTRTLQGVLRARNVPQRAGDPQDRTGAEGHLGTACPLQEERGGLIIPNYPTHSLANTHEAKSTQDKLPIMGVFGVVLFYLDVWVYMHVTV